ncbi:MAG: hypothetical protein JWR20_943, partial [Marmoricola sp.]|nr:hypothetical protein [Marmoricola sp.]
MIAAPHLLTATLEPRASRTPQPPHAAVAGRTDFDALVVTGAWWVLGACAAWAALIVLAAAVELTSGGRTRALTWVAAPTWVRRLVLSLLGATLVGVPATAGLAAATPASGGAGGPDGTSTGAAPLARGVRGGEEPAGWGDATGPDGLPVPSRPAVVALPSGTPSSPSGPSGIPEPAGGRARAGAHVALARVVVRPGDCLWDIAARR